MMGQQPAQQNALFYDFCLDRHIPDNHLLRHIESFLDFTEIRKHLESFYSHTGRPSIDPELMIRMLLVGYCYGIRSERRLCEEINFNLAYRWFCGLGLETHIPDHSTFSKNRHGRFRESDLFRMIFNTVVRRCIEQGLVKGEGFAIDASVIKADVSRQNYKNTPIDWTPEQTQNRAVKEYLESLDTDPSLTKPNRNTSLTDPMSQWSAIKGPAQFYYSTNYMIDVEHGIIMDVEASLTNHASEVATTETMIERIEEVHGILPNKLMGDTAYGAAKNLNYLVTEKNIEPHIPVWDKSSRKDDTLCRDDFIFIEEDNQYLCPEGKRLSTTGNATSDNGVIYRSRNLECLGCPLKEKCCPNTPNRKITRSIYEKSREVAREITKGDVYRDRSRAERKKIEILFAHMKRNLRFDRLRLRGIKSAADEFLLVATVQNLRRLTRLWNLPPPITISSA
ncbi:MAG: putative transposase [Segetibacter sp.]|nr:putative transposase [Segetibacter sp.]